MQHLDFDCSVPTLCIQAKINKFLQENKIRNISHFQSGTQWIVSEHIMGCPVCVTSFVPPVPWSSAVVRRFGFLLCGLKPNQNAW